MHSHYYEFSWATKNPLFFFFLFFKYFIRNEQTHILKKNTTKIIDYVQTWKTINHNHHQPRKILLKKKPNISKQNFLFVQKTRQFFHIFLLTYSMKEEYYYEKKKYNTTSSLHHNTLVLDHWNNNNNHSNNYRKTNQMHR